MVVVNNTGRGKWQARVQTGALVFFVFFGRFPCFWVRGLRGYKGLITKKTPGCSRLECYLVQRTSSSYT